MPIRTYAKELVIDLAEDHIGITTGFNGAKLILFGVKEEPGDIIIVITGPKKQMVVRKKTQVLGAWINTDFMYFSDVPTYYNFAASAPVGKILDKEKRKKYQIGLDGLDLKSVQDVTDEERFREFRESLIRNKQAQGLYAKEQGSVKFVSDRLFRAEFYLIANVSPGIYTIRTFLARNGNVVRSNKTQLRVEQVGFSAMLYNMAHTSSFTYGMICVFVALFAGFGINILLRRP